CTPRVYIRLYRYPTCIFRAYPVLQLLAVAHHIPKRVWSPTLFAARPSHIRTRSAENERLRLQATYHRPNGIAVSGSQEPVRIGVCNIPAKRIIRTIKPYIIDLSIIG